MKKIKILAMVMALTIGTVVYGTTIGVTLNGETLEMPIDPIKEEGITFVPLRVIAETLEAKVDYIKETEEVILSKDDQVIQLGLGNPIIKVNDQEITLDVAPTIVEGHTMAPVRVISEAFGAEVTWDGQSNQVIIETPQEQQLPTVTINIKEYGTIVAELYPEMAPNTVNNFIYLIEKGFYDGLTFHRIIEDFMIQGGCPEGTGIGGPDYSIAGEFASNEFTQNTLKHTKGVLSMARAWMVNSAGSQFFIMTEDSPHLDGDYAAFGKVIQGMDVVEAMSSVETANGDVPVEPVVIESITVETYGIDYDDPIKIEQ